MNLVATAIFFVLIVNQGSCIGEIFNLGQAYYNLTTSGGLVPNLYTFPINETLQPNAMRIVIMAPDVVTSNPLTVTAMRGSSIFSAVLPRVQTHNGKSFHYWFTADTLCDSDEEPSSPENNNVNVAIASSSPASYGIIVRALKNFEIGTTAITVRSTPSEPVYYKYTFPPDVDIVAIRAVSQSDICAQLTVRKAHCPVFDTTGEIVKTGTYFYQTFTRNANIVVTKSVIGEMFHAIFTVEQDDQDCGFSKNMSDNLYRIKQVELTVTPVSDGKIIAVIPLIVYITVIALVLVLSYFHTCWLEKDNNNEPSSSYSDSLECGTNPSLNQRFFRMSAKTVSHEQYQTNNNHDDDTNHYRLFAFVLFGSLVPSVTVLFGRRTSQSPSSNLDLCIINFSCAIEFFGFPSFNNMVSASGLIVVGVVNLLLAFRWSIFKKEYKKKCPSTTGVSTQVAPRVVTMLSVIGLGAFWTAMHSCPQKFTFHLYNYTLITICLASIMWIYSKRHGTQKWHQSYIIIVGTVLALFTFIEKNFEKTGTAAFMVNCFFFLFANVANIIFCYYYLYEAPPAIEKERWITVKSKKQNDILWDGNQLYKPLQSKTVLVVLLTMWTLAWTVVPFYSNYINHTKCVLRLVQVNLIIYLVYYIIQKIRLEKSTFSRNYIITIVILLITFTALIVLWALIVFYWNTTFIAWTAARSRTLNKSCILPGIDGHDLLHYCSAFICVSFILLLDHIDSNLKQKPKSAIFVF